MSAVETIAALEPALDLRSRILREATRLFAEHGYNATSVRELVEAAGCTKPALYYYFENKEAVFLEAIRDATDAMTSIITETEAIAGPVRGQLEEGIHIFFETLGDHAMRMRLLMRAELQPDEDQPVFDFDSVRGRHVSMIEDILRSGVATGEIRPDVDVTDAALALAGMVDQRLRLWLLGEAMPSDVAPRIIRIFFHGVG